MADRALDATWRQADVAQLVAQHLKRVFFTFRADFAWSEGPTYLADDEDSEIGVGPRRNRGKRGVRVGRWVVAAEGNGERSCPDCGETSSSQHSWHVRRLQDLPIQGVRTLVELRSGRWKCRNELCSRKTFPEAVAIAAPFARKTRWVDEIVRLFGHAAGGLVSERLLTKLGVQASDTTIPRRLKSPARRHRESEALRVIAIDDWSWRRGSAYGTIIVDLERRKVVDGALLRRRRTGSSNGLRLSSSAAIGAASTRKASDAAHPTRSRSLIVSICCRIFARTSNGK